MKIQLAVAATKPDKTELVLNHGRISEMKLGDSTIVYSFIDSEFGAKKSYVELQSLRTPVAKRGTGSARTLMDYFLKQTDKAGIDVKLLASPLDAKTKITKLVGFYKTFGFKVTGRGNMAGEPNMLRKAQ